MTTSYTLRSASPATTRAEAVVVGVLATESGPRIAPGGEDVAGAWGRRLAPLLASLGVTGKAGEAVPTPTGGTINASLLVLVGLGGEVTHDAVRRAAGVAARGVPNATSVALALPADTPELVAAVTEGYRLGGYTYTRFKSSTPSPTAPADVVVLAPGARRQETVAAFEETHVVADLVAQARDWVNTPPGHLTPELFASAVTEAHRSATKGRGAPTVGLEVLDEKALADLGFGGTLSVGRSSAAPPRMVRLTWKPKGADLPHLVLVGKGVTFDSGGLNIKPASSMLGMKGDMAGAAAVIAATLAIARLRLPVRVTCLAPMAENMPSETASRPGDVVTIYGGTTVEIANPDAEGRMLLADGLVLATELEPDVVVDVATLTGHMQSALGDRVGAVMGSEQVREALVAAGGRAGEQQWPMPIPEEMRERVTASKVADLLQHDWVRWGGGLYAAAFLREFTDGLAWGHLDMAGKEANSKSAWGHVPTGATGFGVTTLVAYARGLVRE